MNKPCKISIIIRCYNEEEHIAKLLAGISQQTNNNHEIILVDSGSTDATLTIASRYPIKIVYISPEEFSFGRALNKGCTQASGDIFVFISAHCYPVYDDWLITLIEPFKDPKIALTYGKQIGDSTTKYSEHQIFATWFPEKSDYFQNHPFCNNANAAIRKKIWEELHYNEDLTGLEDLDWAKRALAKGYKIAYAADAVIIHRHDESSQAIKNRYQREAIAHKNIFPDQKFSFWDFIHLFSRNVIHDSMAALRDKCLTKNIKEIIIFRFVQFRGTYQGFSYQNNVTQTLRRTFYYPLHSPNSNTVDNNKRRKIDYAESSENK